MRFRFELFIDHDDEVLLFEDSARDLTTLLVGAAVGGVAFGAPASSLALDVLPAPAQPNVSVATSTPSAQNLEVQPVASQATLSTQAPAAPISSNPQAAATGDQIQGAAVPDSSEAAAVAPATSQIAQPAEPLPTTSAPTSDVQGGSASLASSGQSTVAPSATAAVDSAQASAVTTPTPPVATPPPVTTPTLAVPTPAPRAQLEVKSSRPIVDHSAIQGSAVDVQGSPAERPHLQETVQGSVIQPAARSLTSQVRDAGPQQQVPTPPPTDVLKLAAADLGFSSGQIASEAVGSTADVTRERASTAGKVLPTGPAGSGLSSKAGRTLSKVGRKAKAFKNVGRVAPGLSAILTSGQDLYEGRTARHAAAHATANFVVAGGAGAVAGAACETATLAIGTPFCVGLAFSASSGAGLLVDRAFR